MPGLTKPGLQPEFGEKGFPWVRTHPCVPVSRRSELRGTYQASTISTQGCVRTQALRDYSQAVCGYSQALCDCVQGAP